MARIQQIHPGNYRSSGNIDDEFSSVIRYLVSGEKGDYTLGELLSVLFDDTGTLKSPVEMRLDGSTNLQYRVGSYTDSTSGWITIAPVSAISGAPGADLGTIEGPLFSQGTSYTATSGQTVFSFEIDTGDDVMVFINGILQAASTVTISTTNNTITLSSGVTAGHTVFIIKIRAQSVSNYRRSDQQATSNQAVFPFTHTADENILVFRNGLFQNPGGSNDYTSSSAQNTVTFNTALSSTDLISIITVENTAVKSVSGLMTRDGYTDANGFIPFNKLAITAGEIPQDRVNGLAALTSDRGKVFVSPTAPTGAGNAVAGNIWIDTSTSPDTPKFYDGIQWLNFAATTTIPEFFTTDANKVLHINSSGTALEFKNVDTSAFVLLSTVGAASGVASLDSNGRLPASQLPTVMNLDSFDFIDTSTISAPTDFNIKRIYKEAARIDSIYLKVNSGTCDVTIQVDGTNVGSTFNVSSTAIEQNLANSILVDATTTSKMIGISVTNPSAAAGLECVLAVAKQSV